MSEHLSDIKVQVELSPQKPAQESLVVPALATAPGRE